MNAMDGDDDRGGEDNGDLMKKWVIRTGKL